MLVKKSNQFVLKILVVGVGGAPSTPYCEHPRVGGGVGGAVKVGVIDTLCEHECSHTESEAESEAELEAESQYVNAALQRASVMEGVRYNEFLCEPTKPNFLSVMESCPLWSGPVMERVDCIA